MMYRTMKSETLYEGAIFDVRQDVVLNGNGTFVRDVVEKKGAVAVVALNQDNRVLLVNQYRHPVGKRMWELPAGLLDVTGESPLDAAKRELWEETGWTASDWTELIEIHSSPGFTDETVKVYLATGMTLVERLASLVDEEADMTSEWVDLTTATDMVFNGTISSASAVAGILAVRKEN